MGRGYSGLYNGTKGAKEYEARLRRITSVNRDKQNKHIVGAKHVGTRSVFSGTIEEAQHLIKSFSGKGKTIPHMPRERINFGKVIGRYYDFSSHTFRPTTFGIIHYSKTGAHIVPSSPDYKED